MEISENLNLFYNILANVGQEYALIIFDIAIGNTST